MEEHKSRLLILGGKAAGQHPVADALSPYFQVDVVPRMDQALEALRKTDYHAVFADVGDFLPLERELVGDKAAMVLNTIGEGVIIVDAEGRCVWSNKRMRAFPSEVFEQVKQVCMRARAIFSASSPVLAGESVQARSRKFTCQFADRYFELMVSPVADDRGEVSQVVGVAWDATSGRRLQQKIDAIDSAGRELTHIESDLIAKLSPGQRLKLLQDKIIRFSKDLMHFDHFAIRLLDKRTNKLEVVIAEGLPLEALEIDLYAQPEGNGISGYVAATGRSYICHDTEKDPRYVQGLEHCKSSLTVPLTLFDKVIGIYNIESQSIGSFNEDDRQFAEIFARYVAMSLNILDLLVVERYTTTGQLADSVVQEIAQPLNDIITEAQTLMEEYIGDDNMRHRLGRIVENVESIRQTVRAVVAGPHAVLGSKDVDNQRTSQLLVDRRILVADDEVNIRTTLADVLRKHGAQIDLCKDGYEAVNTLEQHHFDLVISDIKMPYRNGYEIFAAARRCRENLPVILMTGFGYDPNHSIVRASQEGLCGVMFKPFKVDQLIEEICKALGIVNPKNDPTPGSGGVNEPRTSVSGASTTASTPASQKTDA
ncbi:MAG: response regulator [Phycisphaeraceae bacterium]|nr:response regulator [Phycisphaeraceae bacterium]